MNDPVGNIDPTGASKTAELVAKSTGEAAIEAAVDTVAAGIILYMTRELMNAIDLRNAAMEFAALTVDMGGSIWAAGLGAVSLAADYAHPQRAGT